MFDKLFLYTALLGVTWICNGIELNSNEKEAKQFALEISEKIFKFYDNSTHDDFKHPENINVTKNILNEGKFLVDIVRQAKEFDFKNFKDKELKYAFGEIVKFGDEYIIGGERYLEIFESLEELADLEFYKEYDCFKGCGASRNGTFPSDIKKILATSNNSEEIQFYWTQMRKERVEWVQKNFNMMLIALRDAANLTERSPLDFWLREYNIDEMENLMNEIQPLYMELHAFIRNGLLEKYGDTLVQSDGLIPHHLFEQVIAQAWTNGSIIEKMFPYENLPPVESVMQKRFKAIDLYQIADRFYQKLGFTEFPYQVWVEHIKMTVLQNYSSEDCESFIYYSSPNIHLEFCEILNFAKFLGTYSEMGKLHYAKEMTGLPAYFFYTNDLDESFGKAAILSASTHHNLKAIGMILEFNFTEEVEMNRLLRKSIQSLLELSVDFVNIKLMADLLSRNIEPKKLNTKYWKLMDKFVGVKPPMYYEISPDVLDMPFSFYNYENTQSKKFESEILGYQIYKKNCELSGKYPKEHLHLCDMHGTKAAGDLLKNMMRLGSSKTFNEVLAIMFPENPKVTTDGILEYYKPLKEFLVEMNSKANVKSGWKHSNYEWNKSASN